MEFSTSIIVITITVSKNSAVEVLFHLKTRKCILKDCNKNHEFSKMPACKCTFKIQ